jgi:hypothetical protein
MSTWKPDHPNIDDAVADTIEYTANHEECVDPREVRWVVRVGARKAATQYGMHLDEFRWVVRTVHHRLGV